jgi:hypothetical protein
LIHHKSACRFAESTVQMHAAGRKRDPAGRRIWKIVDRTPAIRAAKTRNMGPDLQVYARREGFEPPTARSVDWCSASVWSASDGSGLLTLGASSVQTAPEGSCRIVWMIKRMIKPCEAAPSVTQTTAGTVERSPDIPSGDAWRTGARTAVAPSSEQRITRSGADRPRRAGACCSCSSGRPGRPASTLQSGRVLAGGMTSRMTVPRLDGSVHAMR